MLARLVELALLFLKLGTIGFGGPAVHIATMEDECVQRRKWLSREHFLDLVGATNLIPGPNSTEMAIHIGYVRAGLLGLFVAGAAFILPAVTITTGIAWFYVEFGQTPALAHLMFGIKPAVLAIILSAGWRLAKKALAGWGEAAIALAVVVASWLVADVIFVLLAAGIVGMLWLLWRRRVSDDPPNQPPATTSAMLPLLAVGGRGMWDKLPLLLAAGGAQIVPATLWRLGLFFLKVGFVLYGSGYVLFAYLEGDVVGNYGWLKREQLLEAVAVGQLTPGPILSTATFIGYVIMAGPASEHRWLDGVAGASVATLCIFMPSFFFVAATNPIIPRLRKSRITAAFLDAINAASMGLLAAVAAKFYLQTFFPNGIPHAPAWQNLIGGTGGEPFVIAWPSIVIAVAAAVFVFRWKISPVWLVLGGGLIGIAVWLAGWG